MAFLIWPQRDRYRARPGSDLAPCDRFHVPDLGPRRGCGRHDRDRTAVQLSIRSRLVLFAVAMLLQTVGDVSFLFTGVGSSFAEAEPLDRKSVV